MILGFEAGNRPPLGSGNPFLIMSHNSEIRLRVDDSCGNDHGDFNFPWCNRVRRRLELILHPTVTKVYDLHRITFAIHRIF
jgi:hypothetical protein